MITVQSVEDKLQNNENVVSLRRGDPFPFTRDNDPGVSFYRFTFREIRGNILSELIEFELAEKDGVVRYLKSIPNVLKERPEPEPQRELIMDEKDVLDEIQKYYDQKLDRKWEGSVLKDSLDIRPSRSRDQIFCDIDDEGVIKKNQEFMVSGIVDIPTWEELGPYHGGNTLPMDFIVEHKKAYWRSKHASNSWEPGKVGEDIWEEVEKSELITFRPVAR